jgi:hypothetical protein
LPRARQEWSKGWATPLTAGRLAGIGKAEHPDLRVLVELPGIEPAALPGLLPSELPVRAVSFRFAPVRYLRFRSRVLTASRAVDRGLDFASIGMTVTGLRAFNVI